MKKQTLLIAALVLLIGGAGGYAMTKTELYDSLLSRYQKAAVKEEIEPKETFSSDIHGLHDVEVMTERDFISGMIPHHQEAVDSAQIVLARSENPEVKKLAGSIVTTQEKEIIDMGAWHAEWYGEAAVASESHQAMMPDLSTLSGKELDRAFLEGMIEHHMGALTMAQQVSANIEHPEIGALVQTIAEAQSEEIISMRILLKQI